MTGLGFYWCLQAAASHKSLLASQRESPGMRCCHGSNGEIMTHHECDLLRLQGCGHGRADFRAKLHKAVDEIIL